MIVFSSKINFKVFVAFGFLLFGACNQNTDSRESSSGDLANELESSQTTELDDGIGGNTEAGILALAAQNADLQSFTTAAAMINLQEILDEADGHFTIFAPSDKAFADANLTINREDTSNNEALKNILLQHVVSYHTTSEDWYEEMMLSTLNGGRVVIHLEGDVPHVNQATFVTVDIVGNDGVLHVIDQVIEPYPEKVESPVQ